MSKPYEILIAILRLIDFDDIHMCHSRVIRLCLLKWACFRILQKLEGQAYHVFLAQLFCLIHKQIVALLW